VIEDKGRRTQVRDAYHTLFNNFLAQPKERTDKNARAPLGGTVTDSSVSSVGLGVDVFIVGVLDASDAGQLKSYLEEFCKPQASGLAAIRFYHADLKQMQDHKVEHVVDAWVFIGNEEGGPDLGFMYLVGEVDDDTFLKVSKSDDALFRNPHKFASQAMRIDWPRTNAFLRRRGIHVDHDGLKPVGDLWQRFVVGTAKQWTLKPVASLSNDSEH
jgi:hypothetical protein